MPRTVTDAKLESRSARLKLASRKKPHFRSIDHGRHIGYYKGAKGGVWLARINDEGNYRECKLGSADDVRDANGVDVLSFSQAQAAARSWFDQYTIEKARATIEPVPTVRAAVEVYIAARDAREAARHARPGVRSSAAYKLQLHVLDAADIGDLSLTDLNVRRLKTWRSKLPGTDVTRQRVTNDFKAALNMAAPNAEVRMVIKDGLAAPTGETSAFMGDHVSAAESKILTDSDVRALLQAVQELGDEDAYLMCLVLAATGARFAQVRRLRVRDVQPSRQRIMMPASYKGRSGSRPRAAVPVPVGGDVLERLSPIIEGRDANDILLERWRHIQTGLARWKRDRRAPWRTPSEIARPIRAAANATHLTKATSSYSFRHSSIVRALREGLPVRLVAQLHDTSIQMIERNYTRFFADALEDVARRAVVPFTG